MLSLTGVCTFCGYFSSVHQYFPCNDPLAKANYSIWVGYNPFCKKIENPDPKIDETFLDTFINEEFLFLAISCKCDVKILKSANTIIVFY